MNNDLQRDYNRILESKKVIRNRLEKKDKEVWQVNHK